MRVSQKRIKYKVPNKMYLFRLYVEQGNGGLQKDSEMMIIE